MYRGTITLYGDPQVDTIVTTADGAATLAALIGLSTLILNGQDPVAVLVSIAANSNDASFDFGGTANHTLCSTTTTPASALISGAAAVKALRLRSFTAGGAATVSVTIFY